MTDTQAAETVRIVDDVRPQETLFGAPDHDPQSLVRKVYDLEKQLTDARLIAAVMTIAFLAIALYLTVKP